MEKAVFKHGDNGTFYLVSSNHWSLFLLPSFTCYILELMKSDIDIKIFMKFSGTGEILTEILNEKI